MTSSWFDLHLAFYFFCQFLNIMFLRALIVRRERITGFLATVLKGNAVVQPCIVSPGKGWESGRWCTCAYLEAAGLLWHAKRTNGDDADVRSAFGRFTDNIIPTDRRLFSIQSDDTPFAFRVFSGKILLWRSAVYNTFYLPLLISAVCAW